MNKHLDPHGGEVGQKYETIFCTGTTPQELAANMKAAGENGYYWAGALPPVTTPDGKFLLMVCMERPKSLIEVARGPLNLS